MTGTNCDLFTHNQSRSYLNHLVYVSINAIILIKPYCYTRKPNRTLSQLAADLVYHHHHHHHPCGPDGATK
jgi:hypothetical protein